MSSEGHSRLGPSNKRWPKCAGSIREEERYPDIAGEAAIDGTGSHLLLELCMKNNVQAIQYDQQIIGTNHPDNINGWMVDIARTQRVQMALDYIIRRVGELKASYPRCDVLVESESKSNPGGAFGRTDWWGTCDITITARHKMTNEIYFIEVADYKDGRMYVSEKNDTQTISYLFGKMRPHVASGPDLVRPFNAHVIDGCRMTIIQPKTNPVVRYQCSARLDDNVSVQSVIESAEQMAQAATATDDPNAPLTPGDHCQWCKANPKRGGHCTANSDKSLKVVESMSNNIETTASDSNLHEYFSSCLADPKSLTEDQLSNLADAEEGIQAVFDKVKTEIKDRIEQGITVPGYGMFPGKGANVWNEDDETVAKKLRSRRLKNGDIYPPKLLSPAQVMKLDLLSDDQKARIKKDLITFEAGKLTLKKVARGNESTKIVGQSTTTELQSNTDAAKLMFADVPKIESVKTDDISFF